jgi:hypothetical protein
MRRLWVIVAAVAMSSHAIAGSLQTKAVLECDDAAYAQYKKDIDALYNKIGMRPITVDEVMADRRLTESYCLKQAACSVKTGAAPSTLGRNFQSCLDADELMRE